MVSDASCLCVSLELDLGIVSDSVISVSWITAGATSDGVIVFEL